MDKSTRLKPEHRRESPIQRGEHKGAVLQLGGWGTMERKRTLRGSGREFDTIAGCL